MWWDYYLSQWNGKSMLRKAVDLVIESDASLAGWGAVCNYQQTGGPWSQEEHNLHINCLELLAATLALKTFTKGQTGLLVLLKMDNTTAVAYVNNQGGTVSRELVRLSKDLWTWYLQRNISIKAQHLPRHLNKVADSESRTMLDQSDWKLNSRVFQQIHQLWGLMEVDLFASRLTTQCPAFFSWRPDPYAAATDAFLQVWTGLKAYANPPWNLVGRVAAQAQAQDPALVPNSTGDAGRCPTPDPPHRDKHQVAHR